MYYFEAELPFPIASIKELRLIRMSEAMVQRWVTRCREVTVQPQSCLLPTPISSYILTSLFQYCPIPYSPSDHQLFAISPKSFLSFSHLPSPIPLTCLSVSNLLPESLILHFPPLYSPKMPPKRKAVQAKQLSKPAASLRQRRCIKVHQSSDAVEPVSRAIAAHSGMPHPPSLI